MAQKGPESPKTTITARTCAIVLKYDDAVLLGAERR
jgi:hypothetical protein